MDYDYWLLSPAFGWYTFIPRDNFRSPYGHRYYGVGRYALNNGRVTSNPTNNSGGGGGGTSSNAGNNNSNNSNNDGGGGGAAPAVTVTAPSGERTTPAGYIEGKNSPSGATQ
jgi:hypothetical protein